MKERYKGILQHFYVYCDDGRMCHYHAYPREWVGPRCVEAQDHAEALKNLEDEGWTRLAVPTGVGPWLCPACARHQAKEREQKTP